MSNKSDQLNSLINTLAMGCTDGDNELAILQAALESALTILANDDSALSTIANDVSSVIESDLSETLSDLQNEVASLAQLGSAPSKEQNIALKRAIASSKEAGLDHLFLDNQADEYFIYAISKDKQSLLAIYIDDVDDASQWVDVDLQSCAANEQYILSVICFSADLQFGTSFVSKWNKIIKNMELQEA